MRLGPGQCLASLGPWTELLSLPADAQSPLGTAGWLGTGHLGLTSHTPVSASSRSCFPVESGMQLPSLHSRGQGLRASPCASALGSFPEAFSALHLLTE